MSVLPLPERFAVELDPRVRRSDDGRVLVGSGSGRVIRLSEAGCAALDALLTGGPVSLPARELGRRLVDAGLAHPRPPRAGVPHDVTVVIPVRDRHSSLDALLAALGDAHPVVVVDDASEDPAGIAALCVARGARLVARPVRGGPAAARNTALRSVGTELIAFLDSDCLPPTGWVEALVPHFADPALAAIAPRVRPVAGPATRRSFRARYGRWRSPLDLGRAEGAVVPGGPISYLPTAALIVRRAALADGFDDALRYGEDVDLIWRLHDAGHRVRYAPAVRVLHHDPPSWGGLFARRFRYGTSAAPLARRHPHRLAPLIVRPGPAATVAALLLGRPRVAVALNALSTVLVISRLRGTGAPWRRTVWWPARSVLGTWVGCGRATTVVAAPVLLAGLARRRPRRAAGLLLVVSPLSTWLGERPPLDPLRWTCASIVDDVAYGLGVWAGCVRHRTAGPLLPRLRAEYPGGDQGAPRIGRDGVVAAVAAGALPFLAGWRASPASSCRRRRRQRSAGRASGHGQPRR